MSAPSRPPHEAPEDPYQALVLAIVHRAVLDAQGHCHPTGPVPEARLRLEARTWLADEQAVRWLLELGGYESGPVLARLRQWRYGTPPAGR